MLIFLKQLNPHFYCTLKGVKIKVDSIERKILYDFNAIFNALTSFSTNIDRIGILMMSYKPVQVSNLPNKRMRGFFFRFRFHSDPCKWKTDFRTNKKDMLMKNIYYQHNLYPSIPGQIAALTRLLGHSTGGWDRQRLQYYLVSSCSLPNSWQVAPRSI